MGLSVLVAMILSPSLCATFLKPAPAKTEGHEPKGFFAAFNKYFNKGRDGYQKTSGFMAKRAPRFFVVYVLLVGGLIGIFSQLPSSFLPNEDQGLM
jgi:multidrug efflux pump